MNRNNFTALLGNSSSRIPDLIPVGRLHSRNNRNEKLRNQGFEIATNRGEVVFLRGGPKLFHIFAKNNNNTVNSMRKKFLQMVPYSSINRGTKFVYYLRNGQILEQKWTPP